ncbi:MAG: response regulator transcription factor [Cyanobacteriota bacterium]
MTDLYDIYSILIIEDNKNFLYLLQTSLEPRGHKVTAIEDGIKAIKNIKNATPGMYDIILLDIELPGASGWEILVTIRSVPALINVPVIILTALDDDSTEVRALIDGADDFITKPLSIKVLLARIEANIRKNKTKGLDDIEAPFFKGISQELTDREKEILKFMVKGFGTKEIAELAVISEKTVRNHIKSILTKLNVENRMQAAILAIKYKLVD